MSTPEAKTTCRACSKPIRPGAVKCEACGSPQSDAVKCPLCGSVANASPESEFGYRCDVCGGPRVPVADTRVVLSGRTSDHLLRADLARHERAKARAAAMGTGVVGAGLVLFGAAATLFFGPLLGIPLVLLGMLAFGGTAFGLSRSASHGKGIQPAIDAAWESAAADVVASLGSATAPRLAEALGIPETRAEELLAQLEISNLVYAGAGGKYEANVRVVSSDESPEEARFAELEALAAAETEAEAKKATQKVGE